MAYFTELAEKYAGPTLWSKYSMLKSTIICNQNINIGDYKQLASFVKRKNDGYMPTQSKVFTTEDVNKFLSEAPDEMYLAMKVNDEEMVINDLYLQIFYFIADCNHIRCSWSM